MSEPGVLAPSFERKSRISRHTSLRRGGPFGFRQASCVSDISFNYSDSHHMKAVGLAIWLADGNKSRMNTARTVALKVLTWAFMRIGTKHKAYASKG